MTRTHLFDLDGKIAFVSGASRGIGEAIAHLLARQGAHVIVSSRTRENCQPVADAIIALDAINPQTAARFVTPFGRWRRFDEARGAMMRAELERIVAAPGISKDVLEQAGKSLEG